MGVQNFRFDSQSGDGPTFHLAVESLADLDTLRAAIQANFGVVQPEGKSTHSWMKRAKTDFEGLSFHQGASTLSDIEHIREASDTIVIKVDGHPLRPVPEPPGLPIVGNYLESERSEATVSLD